MNKLLLSLLLLATSSMSAYPFKVENQSNSKIKVLWTKVGCGMVSKELDPNQNWEEDSGACCTYVVMIDKLDASKKSVQNLRPITGQGINMRCHAIHVVVKNNGNDLVAEVK